MMLLCPFLLGVQLEQELGTELEFARVISAGDLPKIPVGESRIDTVELRMVERVI